MVNHAMFFIGKFERNGAVFLTCGSHASSSDGIFALRKTLPSIMECDDLKRPRLQLVSVNVLFLPRVRFNKT